MKYSKKMTLAAMILSSIALTGCFFQDVPSSDGNSASTSSSSKTYTPEELEKMDEEVDDVYKPTEPLKITGGEEAPKNVDPEKNEIDSETQDILDEMAEAPFGMDLTKIEVPKEVYETFPENEFDVKEGAKTALSTYQNIVNQANLYAPRDTDKDWSSFVEPYSPTMTTSFRDDLKLHMEDGKGTAANTHFLYANESGSLGTYQGEKLIPASTPFSSYGTPIINSGYNNNYKSTMAEVVFNRLMMFRATNGHSYEMKIEVHVSFVPMGGDEWYVSDMFQKINEIKEVA